MIKMSALDCQSEFLVALGVPLSDCATLRSMTLSAGISRPSVRSRKAQSIQGGARLLGLLQSITVVDPLAGSEMALSIQLARESQALGLAVDSGEAILLSVGGVRHVEAIVTGDKRAIRSLPLLAIRVPQLTSLQGKIVCFEQLVAGAVRGYGLGKLSPRLLVATASDGALRNAMARAGGVEATFLVEMHTYVTQLTTQAPASLVP